MVQCVKKGSENGSPSSWCCVASWAELLKDRLSDRFNTHAHLHEGLNENRGTHSPPLQSSRDIYTQQHEEQFNRTPLYGLFILSLGPMHQSRCLPLVFVFPENRFLTLGMKLHSFSSTSHGTWTSETPCR